MKLYNTFSNLIEDIKPQFSDSLSIYACGPTVYSFAHIGNFRSFLTADLIARTAKANGKHVKYVSNITDVGHLTIDDIADLSGPDKLTHAFQSQSEFKNIYDLARYFSAAFLEDWRVLNLLEPDVRPRASEHVTEQLQLIATLIRSNFAYETDMGVYFDVSKFKSYGRLSGNKSEDELQGVRQVKNDIEKRSPRDFALWKKDENHLMRWHSDYGWGYPGWHIECSAMAMKYLGEQIDIHTGGEDNIFPHHECEIAQSEAATGKRFANYWVHTRHLKVDGQRMAKSTGNFMIVRDILGKGTDPMALRYALTSAKYRDTLNFSMNTLASAEKVIDRFNRTFKAVSELNNVSHREPRPSLLTSILKNSIAEIREAMEDDLNTPRAYSHINTLIRKINGNLDQIYKPDEVLNWFQCVENLTGLRAKKHTENSYTGSTEQTLIDDLRELRESLRAQGQFECSDSIRDLLERNRIKIVDAPKRSQETE